MRSNNSRHRPKWSLKRMRQLPPNVLEEIYFKSIIPAVIYGIVVWGNCSSAMLNSLNPIHETNKYTNKCMYMHVCIYACMLPRPTFRTFTQLHVIGSCV